MILVVDNYDSFTFNLVQALEAAGADVRVVRNDAIDKSGIEALASDPDADLRGIVVSPGPGDPQSAGVSVASSSRDASPSPAWRRKFARRCGPCGVRTDSGWNCTPSSGSATWRIPMTTRSTSLIAVIRSSGGSVAGSTASEW